MRSLLPLLLLAGCAPTGHGARGGGPTGGIVSLNPCADQLLLALVPPRRIAALSWYSQRPGASSIPLAVTRRFRATAGTAEEVIALAPDLVLASSFTPPATRDAFARAGLRVTYLDAPQTIAGSVAQVRQVAAAVGARVRGEALARRIEAAAALPALDRPVPALLFIAGDLATGRGTLLDEMMTRAGLRDAAAEYGLRGTGTLPVETIVARPPVLILTTDGGGRTAALRREVLRATGARTAQAPFARALVNCGGPTIPAALARLRTIRRQAAR